MQSRKKSAVTQSDTTLSFRPTNKQEENKQNGQISVLELKQKLQDQNSPNNNENRSKIASQILLQSNDQPQKILQKPDIAEENVQLKSNFQGVFKYLFDGLYSKEHEIQQDVAQKIRKQPSLLCFMICCLCICNNDATKIEEVKQQLRKIGDFYQDSQQLDSQLESNLLDLAVGWFQDCSTNEHFSYLFKDENKSERFFAFLRLGFLLIRHGDEHLFRDAFRQVENLINFQEEKLLILKPDLEEQLIKSMIHVVNVMQKHKEFSRKINCHCIENHYNGTINNFINQVAFKKSNEKGLQKDFQYHLFLLAQKGIEQCGLILKEILYRRTNQNQGCQKKLYQQFNRFLDISANFLGREFDYASRVETLCYFVSRFNFARQCISDPEGCFGNKLNMFCDRSFNLKATDFTVLQTKPELGCTQFWVDLLEEFFTAPSSLTTTYLTLKKV